MTDGDGFDLVAKGRLDDIRAALAEDPTLPQRTNELGVSLLIWACYHRQSEIADLLREHAGELDVFQAAAVGDTPRLDQLLEDDPSLVAGVSADGFTPLHLASFFVQIPAMEPLLDHGADVNAKAENPSEVRPLHSAAAARSAEGVLRLLEAGASPDAAQHGGWTALHAACQHGDLEMARILLDHGASPGVVSEDGKLPLEMAAPEGRESLERLLGGTS